MYKHLLAVSCFLFTFSVSASEIPQISADECVIRAAIDGSDRTAAYVNITNNTGSHLELTSVKIDELADADKIELHNMSMENGIMKMQQVDTIQLPQGQTISLRPGGLHIMITELHTLPKAEQSYEMKLIFSDDSEQSCIGEVRNLEDIKKMATMDMEHKNMAHDSMKH
ncbi:MAG: copper chaperone PCu(A)C [Alphaproteobacteria bacterium]